MLHALRVAENKFVIDWEDWKGWRFSGRFLIAPSNAGRILPRRLLGILWEERQRERLAAFATRPGEPPRSPLPPRELFSGSA